VNDPVETAATPINPNGREADRTKSSNEVDMNRLLRPIGGAALLAAVSPVDAPAQTKAPDNMFTESGFQVRYADTPEKRAILRRLPPDKLLTRQTNGRTYYMYADPTMCVCVYVGTPENYARFQSGGLDPLAGVGRGHMPRREAEMIESMDEDGSPDSPGSLTLDQFAVGDDF
jgi:hypothetical protein